MLSALSETITITSADSQKQNIKTLRYLAVHIAELKSLPIQDDINKYSLELLTAELTNMQKRIRNDNLTLMQVSSLLEV